MKAIFSCLALVLLASQAQANQIAESTKETLIFMKSVYSSVYAPAPWKSEFDDWNLEEEFQKGLSAAEEKSADLDVASSRRILMDFIYSMRDYHVSIRFHSTEQSTLPISIRSAEGRFFIVHIDKEKLGSSVFPFSVGDEVLEFEGKPIAEAVDEMKITELNVAETDQSLAELYLTRRPAARGYSPQRGPISITVKKQGSEVPTTRQLIWDYTPEAITPIRPMTTGLERSTNEEDLHKVLSDMMMKADHEFMADDPNGLGHRKGFLPNLGEPIWNSSDKEDLYHAYIYKSEEGELIGVVRIPGYVVPDYEKSVKNFAEIIARMEKVTDKLVIDQLNNPGGSVFYLYALASILSPEPLRAPRHRMSITPESAASCLSTNEQLKAIDSDQKAKELLGDTIVGYPMSLQFVNFYREYCNIIVEDWQAGKNMSRPYWIAGVDHINPYSNTYSKPILVLVNELDFSGGDFFPTILQDNERAKIMGVRTAGAGGYVLGYSFPNLLGIQMFRVTESLAYRVSENPIENLGVTPDITQALTVNDRQSNYVDYTTAVKAAVKELQ